MISCALYTPGLVVPEEILLLCQSFHKKKRLIFFYQPLYLIIVYKSASQKKAPSIKLHAPSESRKCCAAASFISRKITVIPILIGSVAEILLSGLRTIPTPKSPI